MLLNRQKGIEMINDIILALPEQFAKIQKESGIQPEQAYNSLLYRLCTEKVTKGAINKAKEILTGYDSSGNKRSI